CVRFHVRYECSGPIADYPNAVQAHASQHYPTLAVTMVTASRRHRSGFLEHSAHCSLLLDVLANAIFPDTFMRVFHGDEFDVAPPSCGNPLQPPPEAFCERRTAGADQPIRDKL